MNGLWQDMRFAARGLAKNPGFAAMAILTLTLGIGANVAIFSIVSAVLLQPLPYDDGERLVRIRQSAGHVSHRMTENTQLSVPEFEDYRQRTRSLQDVAEYHSLWFTLLQGGNPTMVQAGVVSENFFETLGIRPILGRTFLEDGDSSREATMLLSYDFWESRFDRDPEVIGRTVEMNDRIHTIVGVLPRHLPEYPGTNDVWMPWHACPFRSASSWQEDRGMRTLTVFGRMKPEVGMAQAEDDVARVAHEMHAVHPDAYPEGVPQVILSPLGEELTSEARPVFLILLGSAGFILLIATANVTNLTLARMADREQELSLRMALGAGSGRLTRQLVTESALLAVAGGILGLIAAFNLVDLFAAFAGHFTPRASEVQVDGWLLLYTFGVSLGVGMAVGALSSMLYGRQLDASLNSGGSHSTGGKQRQQVRNALVVSQLAVTFVLLVGAGLMMKSFVRLQQVDPGFSPENVVTMQVDLDWNAYSDDDLRRTFYRDVLERTGSIPGVISASLSGAIPLGGGVPNTDFFIEGQAPREGEGPRTDVQNVSPAYFETLRIPLVQGRTFTEFDHGDAPAVAVLNRSLARRYWGDADPIGTRISGDGERWVTVVGVVGDVKQEDLANDFSGQVYVPLQQSPPLRSNLLIRTAAAPMTVARAAIAAVHSVDPRQPVSFVRTMEDVRSENIASPRLMTLLLALFAALALSISVAGIFGLVTFTVSQRTRELGIRMALGAERGTILWMVVRQGVRLVLVGLVLGGTAALALTRFIGSWLYGVAPGDPATFAAIALLFLVTAATAAYMPARRAARVDPMISLREE